MTVQESSVSNVYFNEFDAPPGNWLERLYPTSTVDRKSIREVTSIEVVGHKRAHFFAGIGGWELALQMAGWPHGQTVWTGSCPCQPFSTAGKGKAEKDERHLWPVFFELIKACHPPVVFGEQVASAEVVGTQQEADFAVAVQAGDFAKANKLARRLVKGKTFSASPRWVDGVRADLEKEGYAFEFHVLGAHSVGAPHIRQRVFWVAYTNDKGRKGRSGAEFNLQRSESSSFGACGFRNAASDDERGNSESAGDGERQPIGGSGGGVAGGAGHTDSSASERNSRGLLATEAGVRGAGQLAGGLPLGPANASHEHDGAVDTQRPGPQRQRGDGDGIDEPGRFPAIENGPIAASGFWDDYAIAERRDRHKDGRRKFSRIPPTKPGNEPLAYGVPRGVGPVFTELSGVPAGAIRDASRNRRLRLKAYGNAIVPQLAAVFIRAFMGSVAV